MIYWDVCAGAPLRHDLVKNRISIDAQAWANPSSIHTAGRQARRLLDSARAQVAQAIGADGPREVIFTGSGSEAAAIAILGAWRARLTQDRDTFVVSAIEHPCVLACAERLASEGARVVHVAANPEGVVEAEATIAALDDATFLCALMAVNNETGVVQPTGPVARACLDRGIPFFTDAIQAPGKCAFSLRETPAALAAFSGHKLGAPAGAGILYARRDVAVSAVTPGNQERGLRGGTPSVAGASMAAEALALALREGPSANASALRSAFEASLIHALPNVTVYGGRAQRAEGISYLGFGGVLAEELVIELDLRGICVSAGAACSSGDVRASHVLQAMGADRASALTAVRFSFGPSATSEEMDEVLRALVEAVPALRALQSHDTFV